MRFASRHFPLTRIHPHALAAAPQSRSWDMHELLFRRQKALEDGDLRSYAAQLSLDVAAFDRDRASAAVLERIQRDVDSGMASGQVLGTPTRSSTASCTAAAATRPPCWRHWPLQSDQKPRRSLTMIAVTRPGVTALLIMRMLFTPLGTP